MNNNIAMYKFLKNLHPSGIRNHDLLADAMTAIQRRQGQGPMLCFRR
jgi:hypothetical protein